ncbi:hypothetical protein [Pseudomonas sp. GD03730]|uniref:hypothetical protein n=1 Tax=Pseudomonas sp. GD03730 TaxID=2975375 RepID=UPI002447A81B|nr:hypothetical protein [Pseudomonas sp. GD03730]MDH1403676.1 hypothetical protein [Pseudomonas sp. GD03730]
MANIFERLAYQATSAVTPKAGLSTGVLKYTSAARDMLSGNVSGASNKVLDQLYGRTSKFSNVDNVLLGGVSWSKLEQMFEEASGVNRERSNLWHVGVAPIGKIAAPRVNLLAIECSYNGTQLGWEPGKIGSGFTQAPTGADPVELHLTCYDVDGEIKAWFDQLRLTVAAPDGTFGLPSQYTNHITITHGAVRESYGYSASWAMVPVSCETQQARSADEFATINLTFGQYDYFGVL